MEKLVVIVFPTGKQGGLWSAILRSQAISVIWESPDVQLIPTLITLKQQETLPHLLMLDTRLHRLQPYHLCRWCRDHCPEMKVVLVNGSQTHILTTERQWAISQGAANLLPRFRPDALVSSTTANLRQVLDTLEIPGLCQRSLVATLLKMGRTGRMRQGRGQVREMREVREKKKSEKRKTNKK